MCWCHSTRGGYCWRSWAYIWGGTKKVVAIVFSPSPPGFCVSVLLGAPKQSSSLLLAILSEDASLKCLKFPFLFRGVTLFNLTEGGFPQGAVCSTILCMFTLKSVSQSPVRFTACLGIAAIDTPGTHRAHSTAVCIMLTEHSMPAEDEVSRILGHLGRSDFVFLAPSTDTWGTIPEELCRSNSHRFLAHKHISLVLICCSSKS